MPGSVLSECSDCTTNEVVTFVCNSQFKLPKRWDIDYLPLLFISTLTALWDCPVKTSQHAAWECLFSNSHLPTSIYIENASSVLQLTWLWRGSVPPPLATIRQVVNTFSSGPSWKSEYQVSTSPRYHPPSNTGRLTNQCNRPLVQHWKWATDSCPIVTLTPYATRKRDPSFLNSTFRHWRQIFCGPQET